MIYDRAKGINRIILKEIFEDEFMAYLSSSYNNGITPSFNSLVTSIGRGVAEIGAAARFYAEKKRQDRGTQEACQAQQIGFEPIVFETMGGCEFEAHQLLKSLCQECDKVLSRSDGSTKSFLKGRISIDIQCGLSHILERCRTAQLAGGDTEGHIRRFIHECSG